MNTPRAAFVFAILLSTAALSADAVRLRRVGGGYLLVPVTLNGEGPFEFLLDTGATTTLIDLELARRLGLDLGEGRPLVSVASEAVATRACVRTLRVGSTTAVDVHVLAARLGSIHGLRAGVRGVLGIDFLAGAPFLLSNVRESLTFDLDGDPGSRVTGARLPLRSVGGRRVVEAEIPGASRPLLLVPDSGSLDVVLFEKTSGALGGALGTASGQLLTRTATGERWLATAQLHNLRVGSEVRWNVRALASGDASGLPGREEDGLLPTSLFREIWFDHEGGFLILNPRLSR